MVDDDSGSTNSSCGKEQKLVEAATGKLNVLRPDTTVTLTDLPYFKIKTEDNNLDHHKKESDKMPRFFKLNKTTQ